MDNFRIVAGALFGLWRPACWSLRRKIGPPSLDYGTANPPPARC